MLRSKFFLTVCVIAVILTMVAEHEVAAAPEPCHGFYSMKMKPHMKKPDPPKKEPKKPEEPKKDPKDMKLKKLELLLKKLFGN